MSGRKQHYIPRCLLKGFETPSKGKTIKVWVFKKGQRSFVSPIEDVAAERHFYSEPSNDGSLTLDDRITQYEDKLGKLLILLREEPLGSIIDGEIAAEVVTHLTIRGAHLRDAFSLAVEQLSVGAVDIFTDEKHMRSLVGADAHVPPPMLEEQIEKLLKEHQDLFAMIGLPKPVLRQIAFTLVKENFDGFFAEHSPIFASILNETASTASTIARDGHTKALNASLKPDVRVASLCRFVWTMCGIPGGDLILPDCVALAIQSGGTTPDPYIMSSVDKINTVFLPICSDRILIGYKNQDRLPDVSAFNEAAAACCQTFFVSACMSPELEDLTERIGEKSKTTLLDAVTSALDEFTNRSLVDKNRDTSAVQVMNGPILSESTMTFGMDDGGHGTEEAHNLSYSITFLDCADQETAEKIAATVNVVVSEMSRWLPLNRLDHITFAEDYGAALERLDRGFPVSSPLVPTESEIGTGVAMAPLIIREGVAKVCIVMRAWLGHALIGEEGEGQTVAIHTLANQLAHVACIDLIDQALPGVLLSSIDDDWERWLYRYMHEAWTAYFAARISATFCPGIGSSYRDTLLALVKKTKDDIPRERLAYRVHGDLGRLLGTAISSIGTVMNWAAQLLGHCDGLSESVYDQEGSLTQALKDSGLQGWMDVFRRDLSKLFELRDRWGSIQEFLAMNRHIERVLWQFGVFPWRNEQGQVRVEIPVHSDAAQLLGHIGQVGRE